MEKNSLKARYTYKEYKDDIKMYHTTSPFESSFQRVIEDVLKDIIRNTKIDVIISDKFRRYSTKKHSVTEYKVEGTASPDLLLAENFKYYNLKKDVMTDNNTIFHAYVEVKIPGTIKINRNNRICYTTHDRMQIHTYLKHTNGYKVIFTDGYTWIFYNNCFKPKRIIRLYEEKQWCDKERWRSLYSFLEAFIWEDKDTLT